MSHRSCSLKKREYRTQSNSKPKVLNVLNVTVIRSLLDMPDVIGLHMLYIYRNHPLIAPPAQAHVYLYLHDTAVVLPGFPTFPDMLASDMNKRGKLLGYWKDIAMPTIPNANIFMFGRDVVESKRESNGQVQTDGYKWFFGVF